VVIEMGYPSPEHGIIQGTTFSLLTHYRDQPGADLLILLNAGFQLAPDIDRN